MQFIKSLLAVGVLAAAGNAHASMSEFKFVGTVTYGQLAPVGTKFVGYFSYDASTLPWYGSAAGSSAIYSAPAPARFEATVNGHVLSAQGLSVQVFDNLGGNTEDMIDITSKSGPSVDGQVLANGSFGIRLSSAPGYTQALSSAALPVQFDIAAFNAGPGLTYGWLNSDGGQQGQKLSFSIDSITAVPVPAAAWLFGSGLFGLAAAARRRSV
jgi:hypothetical protein